jgi:hypothetical protein
MTRTSGLTGLFTDPNAVIAAARTLRDAGYVRFDFHTPYPLHGLDEAMGVRRTILPWISLAGAIVGGGIALHLQWWTGAVDYPLVVGGKPLFALPPSMPIIFELTVLVSALATTVGMFALNRLPQWWSRWQTGPHFARTTDDGFVVTIDAEDALFDAGRTASLLASLGASEVTLVEYDES